MMSWVTLSLIVDKLHFGHLAMVTVVGAINFHFHLDRCFTVEVKRKTESCFVCSRDYMGGKLSLIEFTMGVIISEMVRYF